MRPTRLALPALLLAGSAPLAAQGTADLGGEIFWAHTTSLPGSPGLGGLALTMSAGGVGIRASGALNQRYDAYGSADMPWSIDGDFFVNSSALGRVIGVATGGFMPVGFVGIGQQGIRTADGGGSATNFSYGGGASVQLFAGLRLAAELRQRRVLSQPADVAPYTMGSGRELRLALTFGSGRTARGGGSIRRGADVPARGSRSSGAASASARRVIVTGEEFLGVPYVYGGEDPRTGLDCSAFTQLVFRRNGVTLPRTSRQQAVVGRAVLMDFGMIQPGDLLFFASSGSRIDHVAIYAGDDRILHATSSGAEVRYDDLRTQRGAWFIDHLVSVRRVLGTDAQSLVRSLDAAARLAPVFDRGDFAPRP